MLQQHGEVQVRAGADADLPALTDLYNHYIRETCITFELEPFTPEQRRPWLLSHPQDGPHRLLVAQETTERTKNPHNGPPSHPSTGAEASGAGHAEASVTGQAAALGAGHGASGAGHGAASGVGRPYGALLGYATSSAFRSKAAYAPSVEVTVYCAPHAAGRGVGTLLYKALFEALADEDVHRAYAGITQPNEASTRLHTRFGFRHIGTYTEVGRKFGRYWDVAWYQKDLG
ncbi:GNAT family N-acetyltransferase [Streptomyces sp. Je 1-4]|uniref:GNAT family N-acetyltransferase n=1 Tax=Streptomyces TaxID=1883 RepID=UPI0021DA7F23|nr:MULTISPECIES: GNAT family N-acetyltransferase [unclassified Streptomyces]UYB41898.1 GNAT family N-acetyltransferase [Streptomyces sp. Je 1-4]UZQ38166.1 GNAT family N-acetyltransferase [Streptomyces sp. Je 1-4] [Streptomyces sp. Je 1-4 4N24]UZQ45583.1 GNAT family N-acetyltransferase [Streptomyces sp. Je 1-4] [Streptomyces sp. Je 1-4 4N24_ara]